MDRSGADLLCLNSADDLALYGRGRKAWARRQQCRGDGPADPLAQAAHGSTGKPFDRVFEQPSIPVHPLQRRFSVSRSRNWPQPGPITP